MVIDYNSVDNSCVIIYGTYENVLNKIINNDNPIIHIITRTSMYKAVFSTAAKYYYETNLIEIGDVTGFIFNAYPDNTIKLTD